MKMLIVAGAFALMLVPGIASAQDGAKPAAPAAAPAADPLATVYDKALGAGWENWSWATTELSVETAGVRKPIMVEAKPWEALYLHHAPFSTAPYRGVTLMLQVIGGPAQVRIVAIANGKPIPDAANVGADGQPFPKGRTVKLVPGGWTKVQIPLSQLGAEKATIDGFWVQNESNEPAPHFYVADFALVP